MFVVRSAGKDEGTDVKNKGEESLDLIVDALRENGDLDETLGVVESVKLLIHRSINLAVLTKLNQERCFAEEKTTWDSYVNSMLNASPGLTVETAVKLADRILEYRQKKFSSNS